MTSSRIGLGKRERAFTRLVSELHHALNAALAEERERRGLTVAEIARTLKRNRAFIHRKFNGVDNMTLETLADLAFALDRPVRITLPSRHPVGCNHAPPTTVIERWPAMAAEAMTKVITTKHSSNVVCAR